MEIDKGNSTFKKQVVNSWEDLEEVGGVFIGKNSEFCDFSSFPNGNSRNIFLNEKYAKSALALAQISQLLPYYDYVEDCTKHEGVFVINRDADGIDINWLIHPAYYHLLAFQTKEMRDAFYENFKDLIEECKELL